jgi:hypothetical protein
MKYAVEMVSCGLLQVPSFINIGSGVRNLLGSTHTYTGESDSTGPILYIQNKKSRLQIPIEHKSAALT